MSWRRLTRDSLYLLVGSVSAGLIQWFMLLVISHATGAGGVGDYALAQSCVTPVSFFSWLALRPLLNVQRDDEFDYNDYLFLRLAVPFIAWIVLVSVVALTWSEALVVLTISLCLLKFVEGLFDLTFGSFQAKGASGAIASASLLRLAISLPAFFGAMWATRNAPLAIVVVALAWAAIFIGIEEPRRARLQPSRTPLATGDRQVWRRRWRLLVHAWPLGVAATIMSIGANVPRVLLSHYRGEIDLGYFAAAAHFLILGALVTTAVGQAALPLLAGDVARRDARAFWRRIWLFVAAIVAACGLAIPLSYVFGDAILGFLYGRDFASQGRLLTAAACAAGPTFAASFIAFGATAANLYAHSARIYALNLAANIVLGVVLIERFGVIGAFAGMALAALIQFVAFLTIILRYWRGKARAPAYVSGAE